MSLQTRWSHLSDEELLSYRDLLPRTTVGVNVEPAMAEELFKRLEAKIDSDSEHAETVRDLENNLHDKEIASLEDDSL